MWTVLFIACSVNSPSVCYPGTASLTAGSLEECQANGIEGLSVFMAQNPRLKVRAWTCRAPALKGALYE